MNIYDRYAGSAETARKTQREYCAGLWLGMIAGVLLWLLLLGAAWFLEPNRGLMYFLFWGLVVLSILILRGCILPLCRNDLYTFGFDGRNFAVLGVNGRIRRMVEPESLEMIHILAAEKPAARVWYRVRGGGARAMFIPFGEKRLANGKKRFVNAPMALLIAGEQSQEKGLVWQDVYYPGPETLLCSGVGFVIDGSNAEIFLRLLQSSACPVMMNREFYELYREQLDSLFTRAGMDPSRLQIDGE